MANSTTNLDTISSSQSGKEITANAAFDAMSQAATYGRRASTTSGLTWGYFGGNVVVTDGSLAQVANGTVTLTGSATNYLVAAKATGVVSVSTATTNWDDTTNYWRLFSIVAGSETATSWTDSRRPADYQGGMTASWARVVTDSGSNRDIAATDAGAYIRMTSGSAKTATFRPNSTHALPIDGEWHFRCVGTGNLTLTPGSGVTLNAPAGGTLVLSAGMSVTVKRVAVDDYDVIGQTVPA